MLLSGQEGGGEAGVTLGQLHLSWQDLATLDVSKLTPLSHEVISRQATINIGTSGHVVHGKSAHTVRFKNELERNITIKLGYANAKIYKLDDPSVLSHNVIDPVEVAHPMSFLQTFQGPKGTSN